MPQLPPLNISEAVTVRLDTEELEDLQEDLVVLDQLIPSYISQAVPQIKNALSSMMLSLYYESAAAANLPFVYVSHLAVGIRSYLVPEVYLNGDDLYVDIPDIDSLGDEELLYEANHYRAIAEPASKKEFSVSNPPRVDIGASEGSLYMRRGENAGLDEEIREQYFEAMAAGETVWPVVLGRGKSTHIYYATIPPIEETFARRVIFWGDRYPEWILLEYGDPVLGIQPTGFMTTFEVAAENYLIGIVEALADKIVEALERGKRLKLDENSRLEITSRGQLIVRGAGGRFGQQYE